MHFISIALLPLALTAPISAAPVSNQTGSQEDAVFGGPGAVLDVAVPDLSSMMPSGDNGAKGPAAKGPTGKLPSRYPLNLPFRELLLRSVRYCAVQCVRREMEILNCHTTWRGTDPKTPSHSFDCLCEKGGLGRVDVLWPGHMVWNEIVECTRLPGQCHDPNDPNQAYLKTALSAVCGVWASPEVPEWERADVRVYADRVFPPPQKEVGTEAEAYRH